MLKSKNFRMKSVFFCGMFLTVGVCFGGGSANAYYENGEWKSFISESPEIVSWPLTKAYPGIEYNIRLGVIGGKFPYNFLLLESPQGMIIDEKRGEISWTPDASSEGESFTVKIEVKDSLNQIVFQEFVLEVTKQGFYFVSPSGSDSTGDGSFSNPFRSIGYAIKQGGLNDVLYARGGEYIGAISIESGNINKWIAYPREKPVVDVELSVISPRNSFGLVDGFEIKNIRRWGFSFNGASDYIFRRNHMHHLYDNSIAENPSFIFFWGGNQENHKRYIIQDNIFHDLFDRGSGINGDTTANYHGSSIIMYGVSSALIEDNIIFNIDGPGIHDKDSSYKNTFRGNYVYNTHTDGITISNQSFSRNIEILHNIIGKNTGGGIRVGGQPQVFSDIDIHQNTILGHFQQNSGTLLASEVAKHSLHFYNNIIYYPLGSAGYYPYRGHKDPNLVYKDHNLIFYEQSHIEGLPWSDRFTKAQWLALGFDVKSVFVNPQFVDLENDDFSLSESSPACGAGIDGADIGAIPCFDIEQLPGDINGDGTVNIFDYNIFLQHFGVVEDCQNSADLNGDCAVNIFDYNILLQNFGRTPR
jgi:parallel beta-helix repeat protein